jgi:hypothetical protein
MGVELRAARLAGHSGRIAASIEALDLGEGDAVAAMVKDDGCCFFGVGFGAHFWA